MNDTPIRKKMYVLFCKLHHCKTRWHEMGRGGRVEIEMMSAGGERARRAPLYDVSAERP